MGIDVINIWPIYIGAFLYSKFRKEEFKNYIYMAMLLADLGPFVSNVFYIEGASLFITIPSGILVGLVIGFTVVIGFSDLKLTSSVFS